MLRSSTQVTASKRLVTTANFLTAMPCTESSGRRATSQTQGSQASGSEYCDTSVKPTNPCDGVDSHDKRNMSRLGKLGAAKLRSDGMPNKGCIVVFATCNRP